MKVGFVTRETPFSKRCGGIGTYIWDNAKALSKLGHEVTIIAASDQIDSGNVKWHDGIRIIFLDGADYFIGNNDKFSLIYSKIRSVTKYKSYRRKVAVCLEKLIDENKIDIVEFAEYGNESFVWKKMPRRIPMIIRLHTPSIMIRKTQKTMNPFFNPLKYFFARLELNSIEYADAVSSPSKAMASFFSDVLGINLPKLKLIYNGVNASEWLSMPKENNNQRFTIFSAGSIVKQKGYVELFNACSELNAEGYEVDLKIAGSIGKLGRELLLKKQSNSSLDWFNLLGILNRSELAQLYNSADVVCIPSWWENFNMVCLEAMASKAIVIGGSKGGMSEIIDNGKDGFLVEPKNVFLLKKMIVNIMNLSVKSQDSLRKNAMQKINYNFDSNKIAHNQINFYKQRIEEFSTN